MNTDSTYMAISGEFDEIIRQELQEEYDYGGKAEFLSTSKYHGRMLEFFKAEFQGKRMVALVSKSYYTDSAGIWPNTKNDKLHPKISCKGMSKTSCLGRDIQRHLTEVPIQKQILDLGSMNKES